MQALAIPVSESLFCAATGGSPLSPRLHIPLADLDSKCREVLVWRVL